MKKIVLRAEINCDRCRREAYEAISRVEGVESATVDIKEKKVTVIGDADPACLTMELRRVGWAEIVSVEDTPKAVIKEEKKNPPKDEKKESQGKNGSKKESSEGKNGSKKEAVQSSNQAKNAGMIQESTNKAQPLDVNIYVRGFPEDKPNYNQTLIIRGDCHHSHCYEDVYFLSDENPNACSIC